MDPKPWLLVVVLFAAAGGCDGDAQVGPVTDTRDAGRSAAGSRGDSSSPSAAPSLPPGATPPGTDSAADAMAIRVRRVDRQGFDRVLAAHRGKVVLVDFWATWCPPCVQQFPHTVELAHRYADQGLAVISVSVDDPDNIADVRALLVRQKATFDNLLADAGSSNATANAFDLDAGVPQYRVFDRAGELVQSFVVDPEAKAQFTPDDVERAVRQALELADPP